MTIENDIVTTKKVEGNQIMERSRDFKQKIIEFKQKYEQNAPFNWTDEINSATVEKAFTKIDSLRDYINELKTESLELNNLEELFNLQKSFFNEIDHCQQRLQILKELWDISSYTNTLYENWMNTLWKKIVFDDLIIESSGLEA